MVLVAIQLPGNAYVIIVVPEDRPFINPEEVSIVATPILLLLQKPLTMVSESDAGNPVHNLLAPIIGAGMALTLM